MSKVIVLFEVTPSKEGYARYLELAAMLKPMLSNVEGLISAERFSSLVQDGKLLSMSVWESEEAIEKWRTNMSHRMSQKEGMEQLFVSYKITVTSPIREYTLDERKEAPKDANEFFSK